MGFFDDVLDKVTQSSQEALQKTKDMAQIVSLNSDINNSKRKIQDCHKEIGQIIYKEVFDELDEFDIEDAIEKSEEAEKTFTIKRWKDIYEMAGIIREEKKLIEDRQAEIAELKGIRVCPNCGTEVGREGFFCPECGLKFKDTPEPMDEDEADDIDIDIVDDIVYETDAADTAESEIEAVDADERTEAPTASAESVEVIPDPAPFEVIGDAEDADAPFEVVEEMSEKTEE